MKRLVIASLFATTLLGAQAQAQTFTDHARVRSAEPQYETVNVPRNECSSHWVNENRRGAYQPQDRQYGGAIVGGLAGGILGNQVGGGTGKEAATAIGAVIGAITGDRLANRGQAPQYQYQDPYQDHDSQREIKRCRTVYDPQSRITGYRVTYDYRGQGYTTFMRSNPGHNLQVRVSVEPMEH